MRYCLCGRPGLVVESGRSICSGCGRYALYCGCAGANLAPVAAPVVMPPALVIRRLAERKSSAARRLRYLA